LPRLAPRFNGNPAVIEHRITLGDYERKQLVKEITARNQINKINSASKLVAPALIATAGFGAFYFISKAIDNIARGFAGLPLDNIQQSIRKGGNAIQGFNADGSYPTIVTMEDDGTYPLGNVRVYDPGLTGGFGSSAFVLSKRQSETLVVGNFNKNATYIDQLSAGWLPYSQWKEANEDGREYVS